ncbi:HET-domain-containing protein [Whalleya microplaca]|nr:HET-domain-containing protein [Whalleya microplaca]
MRPARLSRLVEDDLPQDLHHHKSIGVLHQSASNCSLCKLFYNDIKALFGLKYIEQSILWDSQMILRGRTHEANDGDVVQLIGFKLRFDTPRLPKWIKTYWYYSLYVDDPSTNANSNIKDIVVVRKVTTPEDAAILIRPWIENCETDHLKCKAPLSNLPTRVVDVGAEGEEPRLVVTAGEIGRYLALSHCWRPNPDGVIRTKTATIEEHQRCIPMARLSNTFRSAVEITRSLGIQYLWIDSLCIIQDDVDDWERESVKMGSIYSSAFAKIAASASPDPKTGCFIVRDDSTHVRICVRPWTRGCENLRQSPLQKRAWVTQERTLSRRTIHYDADQILWECQESRQLQDCVPSDFAYSNPETEPGNGFHALYQPKNGRLGGDFVWDWYSMVEDYTGRALTKSGDKLPAISGIAREMERRTGESWSWAALDGEVNMFLYDDEDSFECAAEDIEAEVVPLGLDPRGRLISNAIRMTARIKAADPRIDRRSDKCNSAYVLTRTEEDRGDLVCDKEYESSGPLYCLEILRRKRIRRHLRLEFRRIGYGRHLGDTVKPEFRDWFSDVGKQMISII